MQVAPPGGQIGTNPSDSEPTAKDAQLTQKLTP